jgi:hypothetical protein
MRPLNCNVAVLWTHRGNLDQMMLNSGLLSLWVPLPKEGEIISLVVWLCSHKPALTCLQNVARHHGSMWRAYKNLRPRGTEQEFSRVFIGATVLLLRSKYPVAPVKPDRLSCRLYDALLFNSLFVHCGTDESGLHGLRVFSCLSRKVSLNCLNAILSNLLSFPVIDLNVLTGIPAHQQCCSLGRG